MQTRRGRHLPRSDGEPRIRRQREPNTQHAHRRSGRDVREPVDAEQERRQDDRGANEHDDLVSAEANAGSKRHEIISR